MNILKTFLKKYEIEFLIFKEGGERIFNRLASLKLKLASGN